MTRLQTAGRVKESMDAMGVGEVFFNNMKMMFTLFVKDEAMSLSASKFLSHVRCGRSPKLFNTKK